MLIVSCSKVEEVVDEKNKPIAFGGGTDKAMPLLKKSIDYYEQFSAKKFWPDWGYEEAQKIYKQGLNKLENKK